jgi:hypothetical protein
MMVGPVYELMDVGEIELEWRYGGRRGGNEL